MSYQSDTQKLKTKKVKEHSSIVDEKLLAERVYYGDQTHVYVGYLRAGKSSVSCPLKPSDSAPLC